MTANDKKTPILPPTLIRPNSPLLHDPLSTLLTPTPAKIILDYSPPSSEETTRRFMLLSQFQAAASSPLTQEHAITIWTKLKTKIFPNEKVQLSKAWAISILKGDNKPLNETCEQIQKRMQHDKNRAAKTPTIRPEHNAKKGETQTCVNETQTCVNENEKRHYTQPLETQPLETPKKHPPLSPLASSLLKRKFPKINLTSPKPKVKKSVYPDFHIYSQKEKENPPTNNPMEKTDDKNV